MVIVLFNLSLYFSFLISAASSPSRLLANTQNFYVSVPPSFNSSKLEIMECVPISTSENMILCTGNTLSIGNSVDKFLIGLHLNGTQAQGFTIGTDRIQDGNFIILNPSAPNGTETLSTGCCNTDPDPNMDYIICRFNSSSSELNVSRFGSNSTDIGYTLTSFTEGSSIIGVKSWDGSRNSSVVIRHNSDGDVEEAQIISNSDIDSFISSMKSDDANETILTIEYVSTPDHSSIAHLFHHPLTHQWSKKIQPTSPYTSAQINGVTYSGDGYILVGNLSQNTENTDAFVCKISKNGDILWAKSYKIGTHSVYEVWSKVALTASGHLLVSGYYKNNQDQPYPIFAKLSSTGDVEWANTLDPQNQGIVSSIFELNDQSIVIAGTQPCSGDCQLQSFISRINSDLSLNSDSHSTVSLTVNGFAASDVTITMTPVTPNITDWTSQIQRKEPITSYTQTIFIPIPPISDSQSGNSIQSWIIVVIVIVGIALVAVIIFVVICQCKKRGRCKKEKKIQIQDEESRRKRNESFDGLNKKK